MVRQRLSTLLILWELCNVGAWRGNYSSPRARAPCWGVGGARVCRNRATQVSRDISVPKQV